MKTYTYANLSLKDSLSQDLSFYCGIFELLHNQIVAVLIMILRAN